MLCIIDEFTREVLAIKVAAHQLHRRHRGIVGSLHRAGHPNLYAVSAYGIELGW
jgi:hypothetical protein